MFKKVFLLAVMIAAMLICNETEAAQIESSWDGGGDGYSWSDRYNWNPDIVPDNNTQNTFIVTIEAQSNFLDILITESFTIDRMNCDSDSFYEIVLITVNPVGIEIQFVDPNGLTNHGKLEFDSDDIVGLAILGNVTNTMNSDIEFWGTIEISEGNLYNDENGTIQVGSDSLSVDDGSIVNKGTLIIDPEASLFANEMITNFGLINFKGANCECDGAIINKSNGIIQGFGIITFDGFLLNEGKIISSGGSLVIMTDQYLINYGTLQNNPGSQLHIQTPVEVNNLGIIQVSTGGGITFDNNLVNTSGANIILQGGSLATPTISQSANANIVGFGQIASNIAIASNAVAKLTGPTTVFGKVEIGTNATLEISDGTTLITGYTTNNGTIHMKGGRLIPQGGITNNGNVIWEPGLYNNIADFNLDGQVNLQDFAEFGGTWLWQSAL